MKRVWVTGYRSYELNIFKDNDPKVQVIKEVLKNYLRAQLELNDDEFWVITGPQMGTERWGLEAALELQADFPQLKTALMFPFAEFGKQWNENNQLKLTSITQQVDFFANVSDKPYQSPQQLRNYLQFMLTHTDEAFLLYDPEYQGKTKYDYEIIQKYKEEVNGFDVPVPVIDEEFDLALIGKKGVWYDHKVSVSNLVAVEETDSK